MIVWPLSLTNVSSPACRCPSSTISFPPASTAFTQPGALPCEGIVTTSEIYRLAFVTSLCKPTSTLMRLPSNLMFDSDTYAHVRFKSTQDSILVLMASKDCIPMVWMDRSVLTLHTEQSQAAHQGWHKRLSCPLRPGWGRRHGGMAYTGQLCRESAGPILGWQLWGS